MPKSNLQRWCILTIIHKPFFFLHLSVLSAFCSRPPESVRRCAGSHPRTSRCPKVPAVLHLACGDRGTFQGPGHYSVLCCCCCHWQQTGETKGSGTLLSGIGDHDPPGISISLFISVHLSLALHPASLLVEPKSFLAVLPC